VTLAGCSGVTTGGDPGTDSRLDETNETGGTMAVAGAATDTPDETTAESAVCDPADVTRPPVPTDAAVEGQSYPTVPAQLTTESVTAYLAEFETAFAWNRAVAEYSDATAVRVQTLDSFEPVADDGFRATGRMRVFVVIDEGGDERRVERDDSVVGYAVGDDGGLFRAELADRTTDPRDSPERQLVACVNASEN
jgi:hypothetical protein